MKVQTTVSIAKKKVERKRRRLKKKVKVCIVLFISAWIGFALNSSKEHKQVSNQQKNLSKQSTYIESKSRKESKNSKFVYNPDIPMPLEHQQYLFEKCKERGLDYEKTLAVIKNESNFNPNAISDTKDYGYFQVNEMNRKRMAQTLDTPDSPLNPIVNINWGTYILSELYAYWKEKGITGKELDHRVWSSYNKGITGFKEYGYSKHYVNNVEVTLKNYE